MTLRLWQVVIMQVMWLCRSGWNKSNWLVWDLRVGRGKAAHHRSLLQSGSPRKPCATVPDNNQVSYLVITQLLAIVCRTQTGCIKHHDITAFLVTAILLHTCKTRPERNRMHSQTYFQFFRGQWLNFYFHCAGCGCLRKWTTEGDCVGFYGTRTFFRFANATWFLTGHRDLRRCGCAWSDARLNITVHSLGLFATYKRKKTTWGHTDTLLVQSVSEVCLRWADRLTDAFDSWI